MRFRDFADLCTGLENISGRLDMIDLISRHLPSLRDDELAVFIRFIMGRIFPDWSPQKIGIGPNLLYEGIAYVTGIKKESVIETINRTGDPGKAVEILLAGKEQTSFFSEELDLLSVFHEFEKIADTGGKRSQREKLLAIRKLFANASPVEGKYLSRIMLEDLRIGVGEGNVREAIAKAFGVNSSSVEHAMQAINDLGRVAQLARDGEKALQDVQISVFHPVKMMLAQQGSIVAAVEENGAMVAEYKYDGSRFQFHQRGGKTRLYSRKLEDVTAALPDVIDLLSAATQKDVILDGEVIAIKDGKPMPFQTVLRRFRRKHRVTEMKDEIALIPNVFDILYLDGNTLIDLPLNERRSLLITALQGYIAPQIESDDPAELERFYHEALGAGHEGIMIKVPSSRYLPGNRGKNWIKIKPEVDTLDLVVIGAEWGEGKRAHVFGSFLLACQENGDLVTLSKVATGFSDEQLSEVFDVLKDTVISQSGKEVRVEPVLVFEVGYSELQKSPNYPGGFALRFPRFIRIRDDKDIRDIETLQNIRDRYQAQSKQ